MVIIHCSKIFIQKLTSLDTSAMFWSKYKHYSTVRYLVITFLIMVAVHVTDLLLFLMKLRLGDQIIATCEFKINDIPALYQCSLTIPCKPYKLTIDVVQFKKSIKNTFECMWNKQPKMKVFRIIQNELTTSRG